MVLDFQRQRGSWSWLEQFFHLEESKALGSLVLRSLGEAHYNSSGVFSESPLMKEKGSPSQKNGEQTL